MTLQILISNTFYLTFFAFAATSFFMVIEGKNVLPRFRGLMSVSAVYIAIAAFCYWFMKDKYASLPEGDVFPTHFRYIDWILTTPLMLIKFPLLLGMGTKGRTFMIKLVVLDLIMIFTGYFGELNHASLPLHNGLFAIGVFAWIMILWLMFSALGQLPPHVTPAIQSGVKKMGFFMFFGWAIYPAGYFAPQMGLPLEVRELIYNIADLINKVGLCLLVYSTAKHAEQEEVDQYNEAAAAQAAYAAQAAQAGYAQAAPAGYAYPPAGQYPPAG
jgi:sensory rhodopsin